MVNNWTPTDEEMELATFVPNKRKTEKFLKTSNIDAKDEMSEYLDAFLDVYDEEN